MIISSTYKYIKENFKVIFSDPVSFILCIAWGSPLLGFWRGINNKIPVLNDYTDELEWAIVLFPLFLSLKNVHYFIKFKDVIFVYSCLCIYMLNFIFYPQNSEFLDDRLFRFSILVLPYFFVGIALDIEKYINTFYLISLIVIGISFIYDIFYVKSSTYLGSVDSSEYDMSGSYNTLPHVLLSSWIALRDLRIYKMSLMLLGVFMLLTMGTRGPVLCEILFVCLYLLFIKFPQIHIWIRLLVITICVFILRFIDQFMLLMNQILTDLGLSTRIFDKYFEEELLDSSSRDEILSNLFVVLKNDDLLFGHGILGSYNYIGGYPHNIFVDFIFSFGWLLGTVLLVVLSLLIYFSYRNNNETQRSFVLLLISASIFKMFVTGTYLDETMFFMLIGFCVHCLRNSDNKVIYQ